MVFFTNFRIHDYWLTILSHPSYHLQSNFVSLLLTIWSLCSDNRMWDVWKTLEWTYDLWLQRYSSFLKLLFLPSILNNRIMKCPTLTKLMLATDLEMSTTSSPGTAALSWSVFCVMLSPQSFPQRQEFPMIWNNWDYIYHFFLKYYIQIMKRRWGSSVGTE